jgi:hypothetical protein
MMTTTICTMTDTSVQTIEVTQLQMKLKGPHELHDWLLEVMHEFCHCWTDCKACDATLMQVCTIEVMSATVHRTICSVRRQVV